MAVVFLCEKQELSDLLSAIFRYIALDAVSKGWHSAFKNRIILDVTVFDSVFICSREDTSDILYRLVA